MRFECKYTYYPAPCEPDDYLRAMTVDVMCFQKDTDEEVLVARLAIDHLDLIRAEADGMDVLMVCDADSAGWESVYSSIIEPGINSTEIRHDFGFEEPVFHILFMHKAVFHPEVRDWQRFIVDQACEMFDNHSATVMWKGDTGMTDKELASLGFRMIAETDLLFRPNMLISKYVPDDDRRDVFDIAVEDSAIDFVRDEWDREDNEIE